MKRTEPLAGKPLDQIIAANMRRLRKRETPKVSQADVAFALTQLTGTNWEQQTVSLAERGDRPFRVVDVLMIARLFGVSVLRLLQPHPPKAYEDDDPTSSWTDDSPWAEAVRVGTLDFWPDDLVREFVMDPRNGDPAARKWKDSWPDRIGQPLHDWITNLRQAVDESAGSEFDLDEHVRTSWEDDLRRIEKQKREHT